MQYILILLLLDIQFLWGLHQNVAFCELDAPSNKVCSVLVFLFWYICPFIVNNIGRRIKFHVNFAVYQPFRWTITFTSVLIV